MQTADRVIAQTDNFNSNFGHVLRSSGIFYFGRTSQMRTTVSLMNYWKVKRNLEISLIATLRSMDGTLVLRQPLKFEGRNVINISPEVSTDFEGSLELEALSNENLVIPYAAMMVVYETPNAISMVHSYSRTYSQSEINEGRTISSGREGCWRILDDAGTQSFCVFHNGPSIQPPQNLRLELICDGEKRRAEISLPAMKPFQTVKLFPRDHVSDLVSWLNGRPGYASLTLSLNGAFTRMLVGNERLLAQAVTVTHSNFDYSHFQTDLIPDSAEGVMRLPADSIGNANVIVYPHAHPGRYELNDGTQRLLFESGTAVTMKPASPSVVFKSLEGDLPSRLVTGLEIPAAGHLAAECSLGIYHAKYPMKRSHWGIVAATDQASSRIIAIPITEVYGKPTGTIEARLYSATNSQIMTTAWEIPADSDNGFSCALEDLFPDAGRHLAGEYGYFYLITEYGGFQFFTQLSRPNGATTIEHSF